jgi:alkylation response protein AidB-like acyl-CoA dehydrogenase
VRPLRQMTGGATFNEVFFTDVRVPVANVVGEVNGGWQATMTTLANERNLSGGVSTFAQVLKLAQDRGCTHDPLIRQRLVRCYIRGQIMRYLGFRAQTAVSRGLSTSESMILKLFNSEMATDLAELTVDMQGIRGTLVGEDTPEHGYWQQQFLSSPSLRIAAGSDEIQRNVIGERALGLPHDIRVDRDVPFRDLTR